MRRLVICAAVTLAVLGAVGLSVSKPPAPPGGAGLTADAGAKNPWTSLEANAGPGQFRFAIVSDRTGKHRAGVFSRAVDQINLLQPEFVMSVGDLIEGGPDTEESRTTQWAEFEGFVRQLQMPFFYVPGNHDVLTGPLRAEWERRFGRRYYHFTYKGVLFLVLDTSDGPPAEPKKRGRVPFAPGVGAAQREYARRALADNPDARWTFVFAHIPLWTGDKGEKFGTPDANGWAAVEDLLAGRKYTVFCGHLHAYRKYVRRGMNYYQLATTGGASMMRGVEYGEFDHVAWVTVGDRGPVLANLLLDGVLREDLARPGSAEGGFAPPEDKGPYVPVTGTVVRGGAPARGLEVCFDPAPGEPNAQTREAQGAVADDGGFRLATKYGSSRDGVRPGRYVVWFRPRPRVLDAAPAGPPVPDRYAGAGATPLRAEVTKGGPNVFRFDLGE